MKSFKKILFGTVIVVLLASAFPQLTFAQAADGGVGSDDPKNEEGFQIVPCKDDCDFNQLINMVNRIIKFLLYLSIPLVLGMIMYTAFMFLTSNGNPAKVSKAKGMFKFVAIGLFWVLGSYLIVYTVLDKLLEKDTAAGSTNILKQYFDNK